MHEEDEDVAQNESEGASAASTAAPDAEVEIALADGQGDGEPAEAVVAEIVGTEEEAIDTNAAVELEAAVASDPGLADDAAGEDVAAAAGDADEDVEPLAEDASVEVDERLLGILESVLFACGEPITLARLMEVIAGPTRAELRAALAALGARSEQDRRGIRLVEVAGGWQFRTAPEHGEWVRRLFQQRPWRLTRATLETLAIVAYKQPITRAEIEAIRGVDVDSVLASLLARKLVKIVGRKDVIGRPLLYGTTRQFLEVFGLRDLAALPGLSEVASAMPESVAAGAAGGDENTWSGDDRNDEGNPPAEAAGGLGDVLATNGGDADPERAGDRERENGHDPGDPSASD